MRILLRDLTPGTDYKLQLRQNDGVNVSEWSRIFNLTTITDTLPPAAPTNVTWVVNRSAFSGKWDAVTQNADASPCVDLSHYIVRIDSPSSSVDIKTTNTFYDFSFETNKAIFGTPQADLDLTVFAVDSTGNMSLASSTVTAVNPPPPTPTGVVATGRVGAVALKWDSQVIDDLQAYDVFMSTSGSGFTPGPGNIVWSGTSNAYIHESDSLGVVHYFKIRSRDVFDSISSYVTVSGTPLSPTDVDTTPPGTPTGLAATMSVDTNDSAFATAAVSWNAVTGVADLAGYVVRYKQTAGTDWNYVNVPVGTTAINIGGLVVGVSYSFAVQAYDQLSNRSAYSSNVTATAANTAPSTPKAPTASGNVQNIQVSHDIQKAVGGTRLEADVVMLEVHLGTSSGFTASDSTFIGSIQVEAGSTFASEVFPAAVTDVAQDRWVRVIAVDRGGLKSAASAVAAVTVGLINDANIASATITSAKIANLDANKITAGTGIINNLLIKSSLTVDTAGIVKSSNYSAGVAGWQLTNNSLEINQGTIKASALALQDSANMILPQYADFEFQSTFYTASTIAKSIPSGTNAWAIATTPEITSKFGGQCLKITRTGATAGDDSDYWFSSASSGYNTIIEPNSTYIYSAWVYNPTGTGAKTFQLKSRTADGTFVPFGTMQAVPANSTWTRYYGSASVGNNTLITLGVSTETNGDLYVDGLQFERQIGSLTTPSPWRAPSYTTVDGGIIRTGEIRSTALANGLGGQPAWSISLTGAAQLGDATVRGRIVVGDPSNPSADGVNSRIHSSNYLAGTTGWTIRNDGYAEFRNLAVNSIKVTALDSPMQNNTYAKLFDYMQDGTLWNTTGAVLQKTDPGAFSAESLFEFTGPGMVIRNATGVTKVAFDPTILYRVSARIRAYAVAGLNSNTGFETNTTGYTGYASTTIARDTAKFFAGVASLKLSQNASNTGVYGVTTNVTGIKAGYTYSFNARILPNATVIRDNITINAVWKNASNVTISTTTANIAPPVDSGGTPIPIDGTTWSQINMGGVAPALATSVDFQIQVGQAGVATAGTLAWLDDVTVTTPPRIRIGLFGFDNSNNIIDWDFVDAATTPTKMHAMPSDYSTVPALAGAQYMLVSDNDEVQIATGSSSTTSDWITVTGYLRGRGGAGTEGLYGTPGKKIDSFNPGSVNASVRYLVPYVEWDIASGSKAQLDQFSVEAYESGAPTKVSTANVSGATQQKGISIENIQDDTGFDHALRFYTGDANEKWPGLIGQIVDDEASGALGLRITPPFSHGQSDYSNVFIGIYDKNPNYIQDGSFKTSIYQWGGNNSNPGSTISYDAAEGHVTLGSLKITTNGTVVSGTDIYAKYDIGADIYPEMIGSKLYLSGWFKANVAGRSIQLRLTYYDADNAVISTQNVATTSSTSWQFVSMLSSAVVPSNIYYIRYSWGWTNSTAGDAIWVDECQLESGILRTDYKDAQAAYVKINTDVVRSTGSIIVSTNDYDLPNTLSGGGSKRRDISQFSGFIAASDGGYAAMRAINYTDTTYGNRASAEFGHYGLSGDLGPNIRFYANQDGRLPSMWAISNPSGDFTMASFTKAGEDPLTAKNVKVYGAFDAEGAPDWIAPTLTNGYSYEASGYVPSYTRSNGIVYLRGLLKTATKGSGSPFFTLPAGYRPAKSIYLQSTGYNDTISSTACVIVVTSAGSCYWYGSDGSITTRTYLVLDGLSFSIAPEAPTPPSSGDTTAPSAPTSFSITPNSSGSSTGSYYLTWVNPSASDTVGTKIIWRSDRYPTVTIPGSGVKTLTTDGSIITVTGGPSASGSYTHNGIPVNQTIYYRLVSYDSSGNHSTYTSGSRYLLASPFTVDATDSDAYRLGYGGMWRNDGDYPYQGDWTGDDNHRGLFFYSDQIYTKLTSGGVSARTPTSMTVYVQRQNTAHGNNSGVGLNLRSHSYSTKPAGDPVGSMFNESPGGDNIVYLSRGEGATVTIPSSWYNNFADATTSARIKGVGFYGSTTSSYMILYGKSNGAGHGRITVYHKG